jgi:hypothetical protein
MIDDVIDNDSLEVIEIDAPAAMNAASINLHTPMMQQYLKIKLPARS